MTIEQEIRKVLNDYMPIAGPCARDLAERMERSWVEAHNEGCAGSERRGPIEDFGELNATVAARILAAFRGDDT